MNYENGYQEGFKAGYEYGFKDGYFEGIEYIRKIISKTLKGEKIKEDKIYIKINEWLENIKKDGIIDKYIEDSKLDQIDKK